MVQFSYIRQHEIILHQFLGTLRVNTTGVLAPTSKLSDIHLAARASTESQCCRALVSMAVKTRQAGRGDIYVTRHSQEWNISSQMEALNTTVKKKHGAMRNQFDLGNKTATTTRDGSKFFDLGRKQDFCDLPSKPSFIGEGLSVQERLYCMFCRLRGV